MTQPQVDVFEPVGNFEQLFAMGNTSAPVPAIVANRNFVSTGGAGSVDRWWDPPSVYRGSSTWIAMHADDDRNSLLYAPPVGRFMVEQRWTQERDRAAVEGGVCRLIIAHELPEGVGDKFVSGQQLTISEAQALVRSKPDPLRAAMVLAKGQARLERRWANVQTGARTARAAVQKVATPAEMVVSGTLTAAVTGAGITLQWLGAIAAAVIALDPIVALQVCHADGKMVTTPLFAWDW